MRSSFVMVRGMSDEQSEPGELTERFQAFAQSTDPAPSRGLPIALIAGGVFLVLLLIVAIWALAA